MTKSYPHPYTSSTANRSHKSTKNIMEKTWKSVLEEIEVEVSKPIFHTFFKGTELVSFEQGTATISAGTYMTAEYIEKRYYSLIKKSLDKKTGQNTSLIFVSNTNKKASANLRTGPLFSAPKKNKEFKKPPSIRQEFTFENFAVSESNQLAYTAAEAVAEEPGKRYNPLFFYGTVGVGKTHLMHAIANKAFEKNPKSKMVCLTTEEFTNEVVEAIRDKSTSTIRKKFRNLNLLLLDDIQFLSGKDRVQEELFHTFNTLISKNSQVVFSSDRPPQEIKKIEARLASRFESGLNVDIQNPDFELRTAILLIKSRRFNLSLDVETAKKIAQSIKDTRALEGFLLRLSSETRLRKTTEITEEVVAPLLSIQKRTQPSLRPDSIIDSVCAHFNIKPTQLKGSKRSAFLVKPRHICMYMLKEELGLTYVEIGNLLGGRDHTTVMHAVEKISSLVESSEETGGEILYIKQLIQEAYQQ